MREYFILLTNMVAMRHDKGLGQYELQLYRQLIMTVRAAARADEILMMRKIESLQNGEGTNQTPGGAASQTPKAEEHRGDDPTPPF